MTIKMTATECINKLRQIEAGIKDVSSGGMCDDGVISSLKEKFDLKTKYKLALYEANSSNVLKIGNDEMTIANWLNTIAELRNYAKVLDQFNGNKEAHTEKLNILERVRIIRRKIEDNNKNVFVEMEL